MKLGMMQPYFYPYLGYWQLMNYVDEYIIYDDVNFIKGGWIHRNRIKINCEAQYFGIKIKKPSQNRKICDHEMNMSEKDRMDLLKKVQNAYVRAPYYKEVAELFEKTVMYDAVGVGEFLEYSNRAIADYLGIKTKIYTASGLKMNHEHRGQQRILDICKERGCDAYINAIGGTNIYSKDEFAAEGIRLNFLRMNPDIVYEQGKGDFLPGLSILDVMMYNSKDELSELLNRYTLE